MRRLPRLALLFLCAAYLLPGFIGRDPWKSEDMASFGYMLELVQGTSAWFSPTLLGQPPAVQALLPYWLGAWGIQLLPWLDAASAARVPFVALLGICLLATWYAVYYLACSREAQPVAFAFGGEADPVDYARAIADGGLLALMASLGLAQLSHEATPALVQLTSLSLVFFAMAGAQHRNAVPAGALALGLCGLAFSGAPVFSVVLGLGCAALISAQGWIRQDTRARHRGLAVLLLSLLTAVLGWALDLWQWRNILADSWVQWRGLLRLLVWFTWPAWPLALWTLWRWRRQLWGRQMALHVALPTWFAAMALVQGLTTHSPDRSLLLGLPALAALAAFALPTLKRSITSLIDWFTLIFFTGCAFVIWVVWIAMQTGVPAQPAANVARLAPGFTPSFSWLAFLAALASTGAWFWLVHWRAGRHRAALWKSMVLPASGAALCWLLLTSLWLPLLDYARSYAPMVHRVTALVRPGECLQTSSLTRSQIAALQYHGELQVLPLGDRALCPWLLVEPVDLANHPVNLKQWQLQTSVRHPADRKEDLLLFRRVARQ